MASLLETNPYLRDPEKRRKMLVEDARASSIIEGARGLKTPSQGEDLSERRKIASRKKPVKAS